MSSTHPFPVPRKRNPFILEIVIGKARHSRSRFQASVGRVKSLKMPKQVSRRLRSKMLVPAVFLALPAILFYGILFRNAINVPLDDDYEALLDFLNQMVELKSAAARASYFLAAQFNEYKLFFGHAVAFLQFAFVGHTDLRVLSAIGNGSVLLLAILLWMMFLPHHKNLAQRMAFFIPVSYLLFQLGYAATLNWAMPSLQNLPVLLFSLGTIYLLVRGSRRAFWCALIGLALAIAASGNGLLVIPIGVVILALSRYYLRVVGWLMISAGCVAAYAYRYNLMSSQSRLHHSVLETVLRPRPLYVIAFIGNAAAFPPLLGRYHPLEVVSGLFLGLLLCTYFFVLWRRGYARRNPTVSYCVLFLLLTAVGVAGIRSEFGISQSLESRYEIYSALFLIFAWFSIVEEFLQHQNLPLRRNHTFLATVVGAVLFCLVMDFCGWRDLEERNRKIVLGMAAYEHSVSTEFSVGPILRFPGQSARFDELEQRAPFILRQSTRLGVYRPPVF
jgi:hypothetical protein